MKRKHIHADFMNEPQQIAQLIMTKIEHPSALLLLTAYRKRIRPTPREVTERAVKTFLAASQSAKIIFMDLEEADRIMDEVREGLWNKIGQSAQRYWVEQVERRERKG